MVSKKGQANMIVVLGMVAATIYILLNTFGYINNVGLSSKIEISAQNSIYQTLALKDYLIQEANYNFQEAQSFDGLTLQPSSVNCGYINTSQSLPFIPVPEVYYWRNLAGQVCLPNNNLIIEGLETLLNKNSFDIINSSNINIQSNLILNLSNKVGDIFFANFSAPFLSNKYEFLYNESSTTFSVCEWYKSSCNYTLNNSALGVGFDLSNLSFDSLPLQNVLSGVVDESSSVSAFFSGSNVAPSSQYTLVTFSNGDVAILYTNTSKGATNFYLTPLPNENLYTLKGAISYDSANGIKNQTLLSNNSEFSFDGVDYNFTVTSYVNGIFSIFPSNYVMFAMQPNFVYYKYILNSIQNSGVQNLLFPNNQNLYVSFSIFPLYSPQVCVNYNEGQYSLQNCLTLSDSITSENYLSNLMQLGVAFVNESFPIGNQEIQGFAQYEIDNYISNAINAVNLKTVSVNGQPKYDWYSALILQLGSPQGTSYLLNELARVKEPYYGTYIYNCEQNSSDLEYCRNLLSSTLSQDLVALLQQQMPEELSFLSGVSFNINVLNLSVSASEISSCINASNYTVESNYSYSVKSEPVKGNYSEEILGVPISIEFGYQNTLNLTPTESCGIQKSPYTTGYPGFSEALVTNNFTYINCAPILSQEFLNSTCIASLKTSNLTEEKYLNSTSSAGSGEYCRGITGTNEYLCPYYKISSFSYKNWITSSNVCPDSFVIDNQNFTTSQKNNPYQLISVYGGGSDSAKISFYNRTFALYNGSLNLPINFSFNVGFNSTGPYAEIDAFFSSNPQLSSDVISASYYSVENPIGIYNYSISTDSVTLLGGSSNQLSPNTQDELTFDRACFKGIGCNLTSYLNSELESNFFSNLTDITSNSDLFGVSTGSKPSSNLIDYAFISNYIPLYKPVISELPYAESSELNPTLNSSFGLTTNNNTYFTEIIMNSSSFANAYQLQLNLNSNFNFGYLLPGYIKIFGVYSNNVVSQLYWWNQTSLQNGGALWINLTKSVPNEIYIVYGQGAVYNGPLSDNGSAVFPFFYSNSTGNEPFTFLYPNNDQHDFNASYTKGGLNLSNAEPVPPYIYNSTLSKYYEEFACINIDPFKLTLLNATYSAYPPNFNIDELYNDFSTLYPDLTIISKEVYNNWP